MCRTIKENGRRPAGGSADKENKKEDKIPVKFKLTLRVFLFMDRFSGKNIVVICLLLCYPEYRRTKACFLHAG